MTEIKRSTIIDQTHFSAPMKSNYFSTKDIYENKFYSEIKYCDYIYQKYF